MADTRAVGDQILFKSTLSGDHILDAYLEAAEKGGRTLGDLLSDIFAADGTLRNDLTEFRLTATGQMQFRAGDFVDPNAGWQDIQNAFIFRIRGAHASGVAYKRLDVVTDSGSTYICLADHTSNSAAPGANFTLAMQGARSGAIAAADIAFTPAGTIAANRVQAAIAELDNENQQAHTSISDSIGGLTTALNDAVSNVNGAMTTLTGTVATKAPLADPVFTGVPKVGANQIWHAGNDGSGSGLDADLLRNTVPSATGLSLLSAASQSAARTAIGAQATLPTQPSTFINTLLDDADATTARATLGAQAALGFAPVQQGTGANQQPSTAIKIGWSVSGLLLSVDNTDYANTWPVSISGNAATATTATTAGSASTTANADNAAKLANTTPSATGLSLLAAANAAAVLTAIGAQAALGFTPANKAGDTITGAMTLQGNVTLSKSSPILVINKAASGEGASIQGQKAGATRWAVNLGDATAESGGNAGSNFSIARYDDAGAAIDVPLAIDRATGAVTLKGASATDLRTATSTGLPLTPKAVADAMDWAALTDGATISVDHASGVNRTVTIAGNRAVAAPTNAKPGWPLNIRVKQDATGTRTLAWDASFDFGDDGPPSLSTAAGAEDLVCFICVAAGKYVHVGTKTRID